MGFSGTLLAWLWMIGPTDARVYLKVENSKCLLAEDGRRLWVGLNTRQQWCIPVCVKEVSPYVIYATIAVEDKRFWKHRGVDFFSLCRAIFQNLSRGKVISGASTITMQVIKNYFRGGKAFENLLLENRYVFKLFQMVQAIRLEMSASKEEILQTYLNTVSYGSNLVGIESASWRYFGKEAKFLNPEDSAILAGIPKLPETYRPDKNLKKAIDRASYVAYRMKICNFISESEYVSLLERLNKYSLKRNTFPQNAFHLANRIFRERKNEMIVKTTLNYDVQIFAEEILRKRLSQLEGEIDNGCIMVVDVETGKLMAYVGGGMSRDKEPVSYIDYCHVKNSPGSALKPFLYCYAMEKGLLYPSEILFDSEYDVGTYSPKNFDELYHGMVDVRTAIRYSLNIPAVNVLRRVGVSNFLSSLRKAGVDVEGTGDGDNLGIILGGCEVSMWDMMNGYLCLAREGKAKKISMFPEEDIEEWDVFDKATVDIIYQIMESGLEDEVGSGISRVNGESVRVCWKTGTSSNRKDAWIFMFNRHYLVGVWFGNTNRKASPKLVGALLSYPVASEIFKKLPKKKGPEFPEFPNDFLKMVEVCGISGLPVNPWCESVKRIYISKKTPVARRCDVHYLDFNANEIKRKFPSRSDGWDLSKVGVANDEVKVVEKFRIIFPSNGSRFLLSSLPQNNNLELKSSVDDKEDVFWYVDDEYIGKGGISQKVRWQLLPGKHKIYCTDTNGNDDQIFIYVEMADESFAVSSYQ
ncbi:MAG: penicillin-binding protein 1C [Candidatus Hydrogenedentes bacterium]|nr:penicillin-binding protein 1C [Candidatus Hydrogenedentota bacterium]